MEDVCIFCGNLVNFTAIWYIYGHLAYYPPFRYILHRFGILRPEKSGNPAGFLVEPCVTARRTFVRIVS
jgi:hypothetical protein